VAVAEMCFASHCGATLAVPTDDKAETLAFLFNEELV
jgi:phosphoribosylformylglycinamidine (FGAM) synthase-like enzyme